MPASVVKSNCWQFWGYTSVQNYKTTPGAFTSHTIHYQRPKLAATCIPHYVRTPLVFGRPFVKRFALCYRTVVLSCLSGLSVTLVYCGQTVGWIKMKLGMQVGLGPGHTVLDENPAPPKRAQPPIFSPSIVAKRLDASRCT